eukprot:TRINITY_DN108749_c0_g1_i1.p1 TRINITY_DN108749_c0_g1~~TRINITY_DN108749_c0_g1_i1.p1  ORF type:complete len:246 (-),score=44.25 TRINITY_DN108749_c0_g1_i1:60-734(-)
MAKTLAITPGEVVVDPMCGAGIILLEAALHWPMALYMGFDRNPRQLRRAAENGLVSGSAVRWALADASRLPLAPGSVDAVACDLPFGHLHGSKAENETLYARAISECQRVLKRCTGRAVFLTSLENLKALGNALNSSPAAWEVTCVKHRPLGDIMAAVILAIPRNVPAEGAATVSLQSSEKLKLPWESAMAGATWSDLRLSSLAAKHEEGGARKVVKAIPLYGE